MFRRKHRRPLLFSRKATAIQSAPITVNTRTVTPPRLITETQSEQKDIQAPQCILTPSLYQILEKKTWEHGQSRQKLLCLQAKHRAASDLFAVAVSMAAALEKTLCDFQSLEANAIYASGVTLSFASSGVTSNSLTSMKAGVYIDENHSVSNHEQIPTMKRMSLLKLSEKIEERRRENIQLEQELSHLEKKHRAVLYLYKEMSSTVSILKGALRNFDSLDANAQGQNNTPPAPTEVDVKIARNCGSTLAIEASQERIQAAKILPALDISHMIEERTRQIFYLEQELAFLERKHAASEYLYHEVGLVLTNVEKVLLSFSKLSTNNGHSRKRD
jgi:hypothetical protein